MSWEIDGSQGFTITTPQTMGTPVIIYTNGTVLAHPQTVVDGYVTIITDSDDLCEVRLFGPAPGFTSPGDFAFSSPVRKEPICWYWFKVGRGPMVFRIRSKRTFDYLEELWMAPVKLRGSNPTELLVGYSMFIGENG